MCGPTCSSQELYSISALLLDENFAAAMDSGQGSSVLEKLAANHLVLTQFELARVALRCLHEQRPDRALGLLRAVIIARGQLPGALWSENVPNATQLAWLCVGEYVALKKLSRQRQKDHYDALTHTDVNSGLECSRNDTTGGLVPGPRAIEAARLEDRGSKGGSTPDEPETQNLAPQEGLGEGQEPVDKDELEDLQMVDEAEFDLYISKLTSSAQSASAASIADSGPQPYDSQPEDPAGIFTDSIPCKPSEYPSLRAALSLLSSRTAWGLPAQPLVVGSGLSGPDRGPFASSTDDVAADTSAMPSASGSGEQQSAPWGRSTGSSSRESADREDDSSDRADTPAVGESARSAGDEDGRSPAAGGGRGQSEGPQVATEGAKEREGKQEEAQGGTEEEHAEDQGGVEFPTLNSLSKATRQGLSLLAGREAEALLALSQNAARQRDRLARMGGLEGRARASSEGVRVREVVEEEEGEGERYAPGRGEGGGVEGASEGRAGVRAPTAGALCLCERAFQETQLCAVLEAVRAGRTNEAVRRLRYLQCGGGEGERQGEGEREVAVAGGRAGERSAAEGAGADLYR